MLVLSRKKGQAIVLQDQIELTILEIEGDTIKLGISAPKDVQIVRKELLSSVKETNEEAAGLPNDINNLFVDLKKNKKNIQ